MKEYVFYVPDTDWVAIANQSEFSYRLELGNNNFIFPRLGRESVITFFERFLFVYLGEL